MTKEQPYQPYRTDSQDDECDLLNGRSDFRPFMQTGDQIGHRYVYHACRSNSEYGRYHVIQLV